MRTSAYFTIAVLWAASPAAAETPEAACSRLADIRLKDVQALSATTSAAEEDLPAFCEVTGTIRPTTSFVVRFPLQDWNGKFYQTGCGGFCGQLITDSEGANAISTGLRRNYAVATMDGGHWGSSNQDGRWAWNDPVAEDGWGWRATQETTRVAKAMVKEFYGQDPRYSYFEGCSTGGRMAHMVTLRQPDDFDGVLSGAPATDYPGLVATLFSWLSQANTDENGGVIVSEADAALAGEAVLASCDAADGIEDGVISDPMSCQPNFASVTCEEGQNEQCLSPEKIAAIERFMTPPQDSAGNVLYPSRIEPGSENFWPVRLVGEAPVVQRYANGFLPYMAFDQDPGPGFTTSDYDFDRDPPLSAGMKEVYNSDDPDLSAFRDSGGKLLVWHGLSDVIVPAGKSIDHHEKITDQHGDETAEFARLFLVPGMNHCGGSNDGPGPDWAGFDALTALEAWVEEGVAPEQIPAVKTVDGQEAWSRPICAYPAQAVFSGEGDWRRSQGWSCQAD